MNLIIHDSLGTTVFVEPLRREWVSTEVNVVLESNPAAGQIPGFAFALVPSPICTLLTDTHAIVPDIAVVAHETGAIGMRSPVRADEVDEARVLLYDVSATAEVLARALMWPFFGITASGWVTEPDSEVLITIVEGALALQQPEAGYAQDLMRSWFVMTGMPVVTHVLLAPVGANANDADHITALLNNCQHVSQERRRELRLLMDSDHGIDRERLVDFLARQRYRLGDADREALVALIVKGAGGSRYLPLTRLPFREPDNIDATSRQQ